MVEFPSGYRNHYPFLLKPRDQSGGVKFLLIVQERSCVPTPVVGTFSMGVDPFGNSIYNLGTAVLPYLLHTPSSSPAVPAVSRGQGCGFENFVVSFYQPPSLEG